MMASIAFDNILKEIQTSNLNFQLQVSPFSAQISLKKSLVKDIVIVIIITSTIYSGGLG